MYKRGSGILLHISSLPSPFGVGDFGPSAYQFVDFLAQTKQKYWQVLPLTITDPCLGNSPYSSISAFAGSPLFISPELLKEEYSFAIDSVPSFSEEYTDYIESAKYKQKLFSLVYERFKQEKIKDGYHDFCEANSFWLDDFSIFVVIKRHFGGESWNLWPKGFRDKQARQIERFKKSKRDEIEKEKFLQFIFSQQWQRLKNYCNDRNIQIIGDIPIYVSFDSVDVWSNPEYFKLKKDKSPEYVAGVPPDYFSKTGQLWGNPIYNWDILKKGHFKWWVNRIRHNLDLFDILKIDHFRGLFAYWEVLSGEETAVRGRWTKAPYDKFFDTLHKHFKKLPFIAEDLGVITDDIKDGLHKLKFPGMKVLFFAFGDNWTNPYLPHMYQKNCVVYTGTHDNNTAKGWFENETNEEIRKRFFDYAGRELCPDEVHRELIKLAMMSTADVAIIPMQDILGLGSKSRTNTPSTLDGNWEWRLCPDFSTNDIREFLLKMVKVSGRD